MCICWPTAILDMETLHTNWLPTLRIKPYNPEIVGFESFLYMRTRETADIVEYVAHMSVPFPVKKHTAHKSNLA